MLRLADQKVPAMDKLYFYVMQTDQMLPYDSEKIIVKFFTGQTLAAMQQNSSEGLGKNNTSDEDENGYNEDDGYISGEVLAAIDDEDSDDE